MSSEPTHLENALILLGEAIEAAQQWRKHLLEGKGPDGRLLDREGRIAAFAIGLAANATLTRENYDSLLRAIRRGELPRNLKT